MDDITTRDTSSGMRKAEARVRDLIREGRLHEGEFVTAAQVASDLQISRTPVREAFVSLQAIGLLQLVPHKGAFLRPLSDSEMAELTAARGMIEAYVTSRLVTKLSDQALEMLTARMRKLADELEQAVEHGEWAHAERVDAAFHLAPLQTFGNGVLAKMYSELFDRQLPARLVRIQAHSTSLQRPGYEEHGQIWRALSDRDAERAIRLMVSHAQRTATEQ